MENPYLPPERHQKPLINLTAALIRTNLEPALHPVMLHYMHGRTQMIYIENDKETIMITIERRQKPRMGITKSELQIKS